MLSMIFIAVAVVIILFLVVVATRPAEFRLSRSTSISAPAPVVFAQVNDLHNWTNWLPWEKLDPAMKKTYEGAAAGVGASYAWESDSNKVGAGRMTIIESRPGELIRIKLEFLRPFKATNITEFLFTPDSDQTAVTWGMVGHNNFISKAFHLFLNMDKLVGAQFEKGLSQLKSVSEATVRN